jgi:transcriptional regulator with XRE-family HTH domain
MPLDFDLKAARHASHLTQVELASRAGVSVRQLKALEAGHTLNPHPETARRLSSALGLDAPTYAALTASLTARSDFFETVCARLRTQLPNIGFLELEAALEPDCTTLYFITAVHDQSNQQILDDDICEQADAIFDEYPSLHLPHLDPAGSTLWLDVVSGRRLYLSHFYPSVN